MKKNNFFIVIVFTLKYTHLNLNCKWPYIVYFDSGDLKNIILAK